jgi:hypothetical protein
MVPGNVVVTAAVRRAERIGLVVLLVVVGVKIAQCEAVVRYKEIDRVPRLAAI